MKLYFVYAHDSSGLEGDSFWNNRLGWVELSQASYFTKLETKNYKLPMPPSKNHITGWGKHED